MKNLFKVKSLVILAAGVLVSGLALAGPTTPAPYVTLTTVSHSVDTTVTQLSTVLVDISLVAGIGFIIAAFFKFHQHKQNPQQVQMTQGISLLLIGCGLTLIPLLIPTAAVSVLGSKGASPAQIGGDTIHSLIGSK